MCRFPSMGPPVSCHHQLARHRASKRLLQHLIKLEVSWSQMKARWD